MSETTLIDLLRHGEPAGGVRYRGWTDDPLSERGWEQMWGAIARAAPWATVISSPLRRCSEFAAAVAKRHELPLSIEPRLKEVGFGSWEGLTAEQLRHRDPESLTLFYHDPLTNRPAGAEPLTDFYERVTAAFTELLERHRGGHVLIVTHAGVIRAVLADILAVPLQRMYRINVEYAGLTRVRTEPERPLSLVFHGAPAVWL